MSRPYKVSWRRCTIRAKRTLLLAASLNIALAIVFFVAFQAFPVPLFLPCTHPMAQSAVLALAVTLVVALGLGSKFLPQTTRLSLGLALALLGLALWLGSYPFSPLGFSSGRIPVLRGFIVTTRRISRANLAPGATITLASGSPAAIEPVLLPGNISCRWSSATGGNLESLDDCNIVYSPPQADYDILKINLQPGCGLPQSSAQIKISILP